MLHERHLNTVMTTNRRVKWVRSSNLPRAAVPFFDHRSSGHPANTLARLLTNPIANHPTSCTQWSFLECVSVMAVSGMQVFFIKRIFTKGSPGGVRRMV